MSAVDVSSELVRLRRENAALRKQADVLTTLLQLVSERCALWRRLAIARAPRGTSSSPFPTELN